jgi:hypothetical protein
MNLYVHSSFPCSPSSFVEKSDDARRLPLRMEVDLPVGSFALNLASVRRQ